MNTRDTNTLGAVQMMDLMFYVFGGNTEMFTPYIGGFRTLTRGGVFSRCIATIMIPHKDSDGMWLYRPIEYGIDLRVKSGRNYVYKIKMHLNGGDVFGGAADFEPQLGRAIYVFEDAIKCLADRLQKRGTIASFKL